MTKQKGKKKTYNTKQWKGMEKMFSTKVKRKSSMLHMKGSTWLKKPPKRKSVRISGNMG